MSNKVAHPSVVDYSQGSDDVSSQIEHWEAKRARCTGTDWRSMQIVDEKIEALYQQLQ